MTRLPVCGSCRRRRHSGSCSSSPRVRGRRRLAGVLVGLALAGLALTPRPAAADDGVLASISYWSVAYGLSVAAMTAVAQCESGLDRAAYNPASGTIGLYQFKSASYTFGVQLLNADMSLAPHLSAPDPEYRPITDPDAQAHIAAYLFYRGYGAWWEC